MNNWNIGLSVEYGVTAKGGLFGLGVEKSIRASFQAAYTREEIETNEASNTRRHEISDEFSVNQNIEIEPCTKYKVDSFVRVKEGYPMLYIVTFEVTGMRRDTKMTANAIRQELGNLHYIGNKDSYTVVASDTSKVLLDYGVETIISGEGEIIVECSRDKQLKTKPVVKYVNIPSNAFNISLNDMESNP